MGMSIRAYARYRGISDTAVHKAIKVGRISTEADGSIDAQRADIEWAKNTVTSNETQPIAHGLKRATTPTPTTPIAAPAATNNDRDTTTAPLSAGGTSLLQARTVNEVVKAQTNKVKLAQLKGELVDRSQSIARIYQLSRIERDAWLNWPARISAQMAVRLGVNAHLMHVTLETAVREHLQELGEHKIELN